MMSSTVYHICLYRNQQIYLSLRYVQRYVSILHLKISNRKILIALNLYSMYDFFKQKIQENIQCPNDTRKYSMPQGNKMWRGLAP